MLPRVHTQSADVLISHDDVQYLNDRLSVIQPHAKWFFVDVMIHH